MSTTVWGPWTWLDVSAKCPPQYGAHGPGWMCPPSVRQVSAKCRPQYGAPGPGWMCPPSVRQMSATVWGPWTWLDVSAKCPPNVRHRGHLADISRTFGGLNFILSGTQQNNLSNVDCYFVKFRIKFSHFYLFLTFFVVVSVYFGIMGWVYFVPVFHRFPSQVLIVLACYSIAGPQ